MKKRILSIALTLAMLLSLLPAQVFARGPVINVGTHTEHHFEPVTDLVEVQAPIEGTDSRVQDAEEDPVQGEPTAPVVTESDDNKPPKRGTDAHAAHSITAGANGANVSGETVNFATELNSDNIQNYFYDDGTIKMVTLSEGSYYLTSDISVPEDYPIYFSGHVDICLNGYDLEIMEYFYPWYPMDGSTYEPPTIRICDCWTEAVGDSRGPGGLSGAAYMIENQDWTGNLGVFYFDGFCSGTLEFYGGALRSNSGKSDLPTLSVTGSSSGVTLYGGEISNSSGTAVYIDGSSFIMGGSPVVEGGTSDITLANGSLIDLQTNIPLIHPTGDAYGVQITEDAAGEPIQITRGYETSGTEGIPFASVDSQYECFVMTCPDTGKNEIYIGTTTHEPHTHPMSADCVTGDDVVFSKSLSQSDVPNVSGSISSPSPETNLVLGKGSYVLESDLVLKAGQQIVITDHVDLCLRGFNITLEGFTGGQPGIRIEKDAVLNICDCEQKGVISCLSSGSQYMIYCVGELNVHGGTINSSYITGVFTSNAEGDTPLVRIYGGTLEGQGAPTVTINKGKLYVYGGVIRSNSLSISSTGYTEISNGTVSSNGTGVSVSGSGELLVKGGTITANSDGITLGGDAQATISGGSISGSSSALHLQGSAKATVSGGTLTSTNNGIYVEGSNSYIDSVQNFYIPQLTVTDGTISGDNIGILNKGHIIIQGGSVTGKTAINNIDYVVVQGPLPIEYGTTAMIQGGQINGNIYNETEMIIEGGIITGAVTNTTRSTDINLRVEDELIPSIHTFEGNITMSGGSITAATGAAVNNSSILTVTDGTIKGYDAGIRHTGGTVTMSGGYIGFTDPCSSAFKGITMGEGSVLTMTGGTVEAKNRGIEILGGEATVRGGYIQSHNNSAISLSGPRVDGVLQPGTGVLNISGGKLEGYGYAAINLEYGTLNFEGNPDLFGAKGMIRLQYQSGEAHKNVINLVGPLTGDTLYSVQILKNTDSITEDNPLRFTTGWEEIKGDRTTLPFYDVSGKFVVKELEAQVEGQEGTSLELYFAIPKVVTETDDNGTLVVTSPASADVRVGSTITLTATPNEGYEVLTMTVTYKDNNDNDVTVPVTDNGDGTYTFTMPNAELVTAKATFKEQHRHYMAANTDTGDKMVDGYGVKKVDFETSIDSVEGFKELLDIVTEQVDNLTGCIPAGSYVLTNDIDYSGRHDCFIIQGEVNLCLNGHKFDIHESRIEIHDGGTLNICDCSKDRVGTASGTLRACPLQQVPMIDIIKGNLNLYGGKIDCYGEDGSAIVTEKISGGTQNTVKVFGGEIVSIIQTIVNMNGIVDIYNGVVKCEGTSAIVMGANGPDNVVTIHDGLVWSVSDYTAIGSSGTNSGSLYVLGGRVLAEGNASNPQESRRYSGAIKLHGGTKLYLYGGKVEATGNYNSGVYSEGEIFMHGDPVVDGTFSDFCLPDDCVINIDDVVGGEDTFRVFTIEKPNEENGNKVPVTADWVEEEISMSRFLSVENYDVRTRIQGDRLEVHLVLQHKHYMAVDTDKGLPNPTPEDPEHNDAAYKVFDRVLSSDADLAGYLSSEGVLPAGNYVLMADEISSNSKIKITEGTVNLCLNGGTLHLGTDYNDYIYVAPGATLNICDCSREDPEGDLGQGKISRVNADPANEGELDASHKISRHYGIWSEGSLNIYGGTYYVEGNKDISTLYIETMDTQKPAVLNLFSGLVTAKASTDGTEACHILGIQAFNSGTVVNQYNDARVEARGYANDSTITAAVYLYNYVIYHLYGGEINGTSTGGNFIYGVFCTAPGSEFHMYDGLVEAEKENAPQNISGRVRGISSYGKVYCSGGRVESDCIGVTVFGEENGDGHYLEVSGDAYIEGSYCGIYNVGNTTVTGGTVTGSAYGVYHQGKKFNLSGSPVITGTSMADIYLTLDDNKVTNRVITVIGELGELVEVDGVMKQHFADLYYVLTANALNESTNPIRVTEDWGDTHHTYEQSKGLDNHPFRSAAGYDVFVLPADAVAEVEHTNQDVYFSLPKLAKPLTLYLWEGHETFLSKEKLMQTLLDCDSKGLFFPADGTCVLEEMDFGWNWDTVGLQGVPVNDGGYKLSATTAGAQKATVTATYSVEGSRSTVYVDVLVQVYQVANSVFVLDYGNKAELTCSDKFYAEDKLPGTVQGGAQGNDINTVMTSVAMSTDSIVYNPVEASFSQDICLRESDGTGTWGVFTITKDGKLIYTPNAMKGEADTMYVVLRAGKLGTEYTGKMDSILRIDPTVEALMTKEVKILPANVVYYEDYFQGLEWYKDQSENSIIKIEDLGENYADGYQDLDQNQPYGNDSSYTDLTEGYVGSGGNSKKITVTGKGEILRFDFKGTGFDLIGSTTADSGSLIYAVYQVAPGAEETKDDLVIRSTLNTAYKVSGGAIYEVPLIHVMDLPHDDYRVIITSVPKYDWNSPTDSNGIPTKMVPVYLYLDGVRIYNPIATGADDRQHYNAGERTAQFIQLRNMILEGQAAAAKITDDGKFTFGSGLVSYVQSSPNEKWYTGNNVSSLNQYLTAGPNNEVYFNENTQTLVLYAREIQPGENGALNPATMLQIAIRNLNPEANYDKDETATAPAFALLGVGGEEAQLLCQEKSPISYTEQYYTINLTDCATEEIGGNTYYRVVISARNSSAFSLTNLKYSNLEFYTIPASASTYKYNSNGELIETNNPNATEMPNLQQLAWQLLAANGMLPEDTDRPEDSTKALTFRSISLSLQSSIGMNFYVADETLKGYTDPYVVVTKTRYDSAGNVVEANAVTETLTEFLQVTAAGEACHMFHFSNIAAKEMNSTITLTLWATKDGEKVEGETRTYSVVQYAQNMLEKTQDAKLKTLLADMLNYGAAAQIHFNYNNSEETLANNASEEIRNAVATYATTAAPEVKSYITTSSTDGDQLIQMEMVISNVSLSLKDRVEANFYMQDMGETQDLSKATLVVAYEDITGNVVQQQIKGTDFTQVKDTTGRTLYKAIFNKLNATEMRSIMNVWVVDESGMRISNAITYSVESYVATMKEKAGTSAELQSLLEAMMKYGDAAEAYFHALAASGSAS